MTTPQAMLTKAELYEAACELKNALQGAPTQHRLLVDALYTAAARAHLSAGRWRDDIRTVELVDFLCDAEWASPEHARDLLITAINRAASIKYGPPPTPSGEEQK